MPFLEADERVEADGPLPKAVRQQAVCLVSIIVLASCATLGAVWVCSKPYPMIFSHALIAFALGLRHAVDCDHLAAIDNVTRQLMNQGQRPVSIGLWFALGHSSVVLLLTAVIACGYSWALEMAEEGSGLTARVSLVAAIVSITILAGIGFLNAQIATSLFREWVGLQGLDSDAQEKQLQHTAEASLRTALSSIPFLKRICEHVSQPPKMYAVGFLFGLSFDSATQVGLIGLAAMTGTKETIPSLVVMFFPLAFSCGMCLVDTLNGILMLATYSWTSMPPIQKFFYNFVVTAMSAGIALIICSLELLQIVARQLGFTGPVWEFIDSVDMATIGYTVIFSFILIFLIAVVLGQGCKGSLNICDGGVTAGLVSDLAI